MTSSPDPLIGSAVVPTGKVLILSPAQIRPNTNNPRMLFDPEPLQDLRDNIRAHGVLVPITVYALPGSEKFAILDGARRHRCCVELEDEGLTVRIPANVVEPPTRLAGLLYMFSIHNFREQWELMPTALSLKVVMKELGEGDPRKLSHLTGLSEKQVERCRILLRVPDHLQQLSLDPDPKTRIPSNFWIEAEPVAAVVEQELPALGVDLDRTQVLERLVEKYRAKRIRSVIHFRRILEALELSDDTEQRQRVLARLAEYIRDVGLETRAAFDEFVVENRRAQSVLRACETLIAQIARGGVAHSQDQDRQELITMLRRVEGLVQELMSRLEFSSPPGAEAEGAREDDN